MFCFAGRKANLELQFRWVNRVLELYPEVEYHLWSMARDPADKAWLASLPGGPRAIVRHEFADLKRAPAYRAVWRHYASDKAYKHTIFAKVDDDVVFADPYRFDRLLDEVTRDGIVSADVVNNGACNSLHPEMNGCLALNTHDDTDCAELAHSWFLHKWRDLIYSPVSMHPVDLWLSINLIAMTWPTLRTLTRLLKQPAPPVIAGWEHGRLIYGDEGAAQTLPRVILSGVMAAHLTYGTQHPTQDQLQSWREGYSQILDEIL